MTSQDKTRQNIKRQDKTKNKRQHTTQDKTRQDNTVDKAKTRQDKTRQDRRRALMLRERKFPCSVNARLNLLFVYFRYRLVVKIKILNLFETHSQRTFDDILCI